jgi:hypothetical protein
MELPQGVVYADSGEVRMESRVQEAGDEALNAVVSRERNPVKPQKSLNQQANR